MSQANELQKVDHAALKVNQSFIIGLNILGYVLNQPILAAIVTLFMLLGTALKRPGFGFVYKYALKPAGIVKPDMIEDNPEPHRFAQGFGAVVMLIAVNLLYGSAATIGWALAWLVVALAALNLFGGFCVGCFFYYQLGKLDAPGFNKAPPAGTFPGAKPR